MTVLDLSPEALCDRLSAAEPRVWADEHRVDAEQAHAYAALHDARNVPPGYAAAGFGAALTMRTVLVVLHDEELALPFDRNVHAAQQLDWHAGLRLGARLTTTARVRAVRLKERAVFFDIVTRTHEGDRLVMAGTATQAVRHG